MAGRASVQKSVTFEDSLRASVEAARGRVANIENEMREPARSKTKEIEDQAKILGQEQIDLDIGAATAGEIVGNFEAITPDKYSLVVVTAKKCAQLKDATGQMKSIYEACRDDFEGQNWGRIADKFREEAQLRREMISSLNAQLIQAEMEGNSVNKERLKSLELEMDKAKEVQQKAEVKWGKFKDLRDKYYKDFLEKFGEGRESEALEQAEKWAEKLMLAEEQKEERESEKPVGKDLGGDIVAQSPRGDENDLKNTKVDANNRPSDQSLEHATQRAEARGFNFRREPLNWLTDNTWGNTKRYFLKLLGREVAVEGVTTAGKAVVGGGVVASAEVVPVVASEVGATLVGGAATTTAAVTTAGAVAAPGTVATSAVVAGEAVAGGTAVATTAVTGTTATSVAAVTGPVGWVVAAGLFLKSLPRLVGKLIGWFKRAIFGEFGADVNSKMQVLFKKQSSKIFSAEGIGAILGGVLGTFLFPIPIVGTVIGAFLGGILGGGLKGAFFAKGGQLKGRSGGLGSTAKKVGFLVVLTGTSSLSALMWVFIVLGIFVVVSFLGQGEMEEIFAQPVEHESLGQVSKAVFSVQKTATPSELPNYDGTKATVTYKLVITPESSTFKVNSIVDEKKRTGKSGDVTLGKENLDVTKLVANGNNLELSYSYDISGANFKDSYLINTATVEGVDTTTNEKETQVASFAVRINNPPTQQPYGFPAIGMVSSLDLVSGNLQHWSYFRVLGKKIPGGIDIAGPGGTVISSTSEGKVMDAGFDSEVGGFVYVQSGPYVVEYLHLENPSVSKGQMVTRGMQIGKTYTGKLPATRGEHPEHVHYQIALSGGNVDFNLDNNAGSCLNGKIEPVKPPDYPGQIKQEWVAPECK